jgi:hypothetical protein
MTTERYRPPASRNETPVTGPPYYSNCQRLVILDFPTPEEAEAWDRAGQPIHLEPS